MQLKSKTALVTGGGSGIGRAIALGLAGEGAAVAIADIEQDRVQHVEREARDLGLKALALRADVAEENDVEEMVQMTVDTFGTVDILINNAGAASRGFVAECAVEDWDRVIAVNLRGTFLCSRAALRHMIPRRSGKVLNIVSGLGIRGSPGGAAYGASKAGIINLTKSLAREVAGFGINVNAITPGLTDTPFWRASQSPEQIDRTLRSGLIGQPTDMVSTVVFLCTDAGRMLSGAVIERELFLADS